MPDIPEGDFEKGKKIFKQRCAQCHEITSNSTKTGPTLNGVVGRKSGQVSGFDYSAANKNKGVTWSRETLFDYLKDPQKVHPWHKNGLRRLEKGERACRFDQIHRG
ncbi:Cytochrome c domain-containing protein [Aphelenchoides bicaudatus]|nr:Cytochrome c domain-containing protein [Aphelenchoides bicaudatus]